jgi:hypothetical protein
MINIYYRIIDIVKLAHVSTMPAERVCAVCHLSQTFRLRKGDPGKDGTEAEQMGKDGERTDQD